MMESWTALRFLHLFALADHEGRAHSVHKIHLALADVLHINSHRVTLTLGLLVAV